MSLSRRQTTYKPRLVLTSTQAQEHNLLEGYGTTYASEKQRSVSADLITMGWLKDWLDLQVKGEMDLRKQILMGTS